MATARSHLLLYAAQRCLTLGDPVDCSRLASLSFTISWSLPRSVSAGLVMPPSHLILCRPLLLSSIFPSIRVFSSESVLHIRWPKYWSFSFSISPSNEHPGLISFMMDWLDLLAVQGALKSLLQHHSSKASIFWHSAVPTVQQVRITEIYSHSSGGQMFKIKVLAGLSGQSHALS